MSGISDVLIKKLDRLDKDSFKKFKNYLERDGKIPTQKLEKAAVYDVVAMMVQAYCESDCGSVVSDILRKMDKNQLALEVDKELPSVGGQQYYPGLAGGGGGVNVNATAHSGGMLNAPTVTGCNIGGNVTFNESGRRPVPQQEGHGFFKKHKGELEVRLGILPPLLIALERNGVLSVLEREEVQSKPTRQEKNYTLMSMLDRKGHKAQNRFYEALKAHDLALVEDLEQPAM